MDGVQFGDSSDTSGSSRAKRLCISIEPLPDRRIYRIDDRGVETYDEYVRSRLALHGYIEPPNYRFSCICTADRQMLQQNSEQAPDEKLKFLAQLIHEPERTETDNNRQTIERALGTAIDQFTRLKNTAAKLANPDSEFALGQVEAPPPSPEDAENITMAAFQSRQNQLKASSDLLQGVLGRLRQTVKHQRGFHEDFQALTRSRWRLISPDQDWRPDVWHEPLNVIVKRLSNTYRSLELYRSSEGTLTAMCSHQHTGTTVRIEAHNMNRKSPQLYYSTGLRGDISDLYRPLSNTYFARNVGDIHRLWLWVTKSIEDHILWTSIKKAAATEGLEIRDDEVILQLPDSPQVFSVRALKPKHVVPTVSNSSNTTPSSDMTAPSTSAAPAQGTQPISVASLVSPSAASGSAMDVDEATQDGDKQVNGETTPTVAENPSTPFSSAVQVNRKASYVLMRNRLAEGSSQSDIPSYNTASTSSLVESAETGDYEDPSLADHDNFESDFDIALTQDLIMLTLKQATIIQQHGLLLDQTRFPLFPVRRLAHPVLHQCLTPAVLVSHHFRQLLELSRALDDISFAISRTSGLGPLETHFEPTQLATVSAVRISFCTFEHIYSINEGSFVVSPLQTLNSVVEFVQFLLHTLRIYILESAARHTQALTGPDTATTSSRSVTFPVGLQHPLTAGKSQKQQQLANFFGTFDFPPDSPLGISPVLKIHPRIPGMPVTNFKYPIETNIWHSLPGFNFVDKLSSLLLETK